MMKRKIIIMVIAQLLFVLGVGATKTLNQG